MEYNQPTPPQSGRGMAGSAKYGFYAGLIPTQTNTLAGLKPPQGAGVLNPLANKTPDCPETRTFRPEVAFLCFVKALRPYGRL
jgi:hypothetical protein